MEEYPKEFKVCPYCGSEKLVVHDAVKSMISKMKIVPEPFFAAHIQQQVNLINEENLNGDHMPAIMMFFDYCGGCGVQRLVRVEQGQVPVLKKSAPLFIPQMDMKNITRNHKPLNS